MFFLKYLLTFAGIGLLLAAAAILIHDLYRILVVRPKEDEEPTTPPDLNWRPAAYLALAGFIPLLTGISIALVPDGYAGIRVSQLAGALPGTMYPGVHCIIPLMERVQLYNTRERLYTTNGTDDPKKKPETLRVQTKEGLTVGMMVTVRYRIDPSRLPHIHNNLPQPLEEEIVPPVVASAFREIAPAHMVREVFASKREDIRSRAAGVITKRLAADGIVVKEVILRDIVLPAEYAKGLEGLLLKEQESERMGVELDLKQKLVRAAELEAEAEKAREVKQAEAQAQVTVLQAKAQADAMQHTLPLKEKQIQQTRLEAEARKEATVKNAEAMAQAKVIDSKAELERRKLMSEADDFNIRRVASANAERLRTEAIVLKENPLLIQKIIAEKLSDKVQIMMVPNDGKFFFANDVLKGMPTVHQ
ncbi:MAG: SPFH domain-containing protein [Bryobacteraceae bacterium]